MRELADTAAATSPEPAEVGRYAYVRTRWWGENASSSKKQGTVQRTITYDSRLWRANDGSGRQDVMAVPGQPSREPGSSTYPAGGLAGVVPEPITTRPDVLAAQLRTHSPQMGPQWVLRAVADVHQLHATPQPVRVALLRVLASASPALQCEGRVADWAGRTGVAVAVNSNANGMRDRLIFDQTGRLLAAEQVFLRNPPALSGDVPRTCSYWLFMGNTRVDQLPSAYLPG